MSGFDSDAKAQTALRLIQKFGDDVHLRRYMAETDSPWRDSPVTPYTDYPAYAVRIPFMPNRSGEIVEVEADQIFIARCAVEPVPTDILVSNGQGYTLSEVVHFKPRGELIVSAGKVSKWPVRLA